MHITAIKNTSSIFRLMARCTAASKPQLFFHGYVLTNTTVSFCFNSYCTQITPVVLKHTSLTWSHIRLLMRWLHTMLMH
jgi:hypothetical protein